MRGKPACHQHLQKERLKFMYHGSLKNKVIYPANFMVYVINFKINQSSAFMLRINLI